MLIFISSKVFYHKGIFFLPNEYILISNLLNVWRMWWSNSQRWLWCILIICCDSNYATFFSLAQQRFIFCFHGPGIQEQRPHELLVKPSARPAVTGSRWSTCKASHMDVGCPCSLLPHGQRQQFLKSSIIHSHLVIPPSSKWSEKESKERSPSVSVLDKTHSHCHMLLLTQSSHEYRMSKYHIKAQLPGGKEGPMEPFGAGYQHAFIGNRCLGIYFFVSTGYRKIHMMCIVAWCTR